MLVDDDGSHRFNGSGRRRPSSMIHSLSLTLTLSLILTLFCFSLSFSIIENLFVARLLASDVSSLKPPAISRVNSTHKAEIVLRTQN